MVLITRQWRTGVNPGRSIEAVKELERIVGMPLQGEPKEVKKSKL